MKPFLMTILLALCAVGCQGEVEVSERFCNVSVASGGTTVAACLQLTCVTTSCSVRRCSSYSNDSRVADEVEACLGEERLSRSLESDDGIPGTVVCFSADERGLDVCEALVE